ncbi:MAG: ChbG/HpnK family deacetylase [Gammaproteobacteria bacterium]|nr:ChbG/HpnK family deacetylase [Gammaproteobacteria bacterium]
MKRIILCADDYGQNPAISQAIIALLEKKRLSATSCLTTSADWLEQARNLESFKNQADIGLHFNLTEETPLAEPVSRLILKSHLRLLNKKAIIAECHAQLDLFLQGTGRLPDFIDGHQHVHQFPVIRDALFTVYEERLRDNQTYVRCTYNPNSLLRFQAVGYTKQLIIQLCGAREFKRQLLARQIPHNHSFSGIYDFENAAKYAEFFPQFVQQVQEGGLIMCHPGLKEATPSTDTIANSRIIEYDYLSTDKFPNVDLIRFKETLK